MYGCFVVEPNDDGADLGVVFFHNAGYSTACGTGRSPSSPGRSTRACVERREGRTASSSTCPPAARDVGAGRGRPRSLGAVPERPRRSSGRRASSSRERTVDVAFGGAFYASVEERVEPSELPRLIELGRELKRELEASQDVVHPLEPELRTSTA